MGALAWDGEGAAALGDALAASPDTAQTLDALATPAPAAGAVAVLTAVRPALVAACRAGAAPPDGFARSVARVVALAEGAGKR